MIQASLVGVSPRANYYKGVVNGHCETWQEGETSVFFCKPETLFPFKMRVRVFAVFLNASPRLVQLTLSDIIILGMVGRSETSDIMSANV